MGIFAKALDFIALQKKVESKENTIEELQLKLKKADIELRELIIKNYPIGAVVGTYCQRDSKELIIVGYIIEDVPVPLIQVAIINPRANNAFGISNCVYSEVKVHGYWNDIMKGA